jgi:phosphinothricin acetyltransferase
MRVQPADESHIADIARIYNQAVRHTVATFDTEEKTAGEMEVWFRHHDARFAVFVAGGEGPAAGWASLSRWSDRGAYRDTAEVSIYVDERCRDRGIGQKLLERLVEHARRQGFHTLLARIAGDNEASVHIHDKLGFRMVGTMREVGYKFGRFIDVHLMQLMLPPRPVPWTPLTARPLRFSPSGPPSRSHAGRPPTPCSPP